MSLHRRAAKRDATESAIVQALEAVGAKVIRLSAFDLLALYKCRITMLEAKSARGKKQTMCKKTASQEALIRDGWPLHFVTTPEQALKAIGAISPLGPSDHTPRSVSKLVSR